MASFRNRAQERKNKRGKVTRPRLVIPFDRRELADWLERKFPAGVARCTYCNYPVDLFSVNLDHVVPVSLGGSMGLENLVPACEDCNRVKGELTATDFRKLRDLLCELSIGGHAEVLKRLRTGAMGARLRWFGKAKAAGA
jgi:5-methylcytosine-specific restriction endonuclease McrA